MPSRVGSNQPKPPANAGARGNHRRQFRRQGRIRKIGDFQPRARQLTSPAGLEVLVPEGGAYSALKRVLLGRPIPTHLAHHERLSKVTGLAVLSSDALSSVAYATEEILRVLVIGGFGALTFSTPIGLLIATLLALVAFSYRQTIYAYPSGGG